ncbi:hypothetical protein A9Q86_04650 [Flavobacteriales bacterium 33_180_T64]|nr:hypothetical protein A9Q86_04650 [Flavobacteriales bacterium 33_180_T64]
MNRDNVKLIITMVSILMSFCLFAQPEGQGGRPAKREKPDASKILSLLDVNNDDKIDREEALNDKRGKIAKNFNEIDTNADEFIDLDELKVSLNNRKPKKVSAKKIIKMVDDDGDGKLNELEVAAKNKRQLLLKFKEIDTNQDNQIDLEELEVFYSKSSNRKRKKRT